MNLFEAKGAEILSGLLLHIGSINGANHYNFQLSL